jgi:hypothetical protein
MMNINKIFYSLSNFLVTKFHYWYNFIKLCAIVPELAPGKCT